MTASSSYYQEEEPHYGRLNETRRNGAWCPQSTRNSEYLQVDMGIVYDVCAVATQGRAESPSEWVTGYTLRFSLDGIIWNSYYENSVEKVSKLLIRFVLIWIQIINHSQRDTRKKLLNHCSNCP